MSIKVKVLSGVLVAVATFAAIKLVPARGTDAPYNTAFRVTHADAQAACPPFRCVPNPARCVSYLSGGCNVIPGSPARCGPVRICAIEYVE